MALAMTLAIAIAMALWATFNFEVLMVACESSVACFFHV